MSDKSIDYNFTDEDGDEVLARYTKRHCMCSGNCEPDILEVWEYGDSVEDHPHLLKIESSTIAYFIQDCIEARQQLSTVKAELEQEKDQLKLVYQSLDVRDQELNFANKEISELAKYKEWSARLEQSVLTLKAELEEAHQEIASLQQCDCIERGAE